MWKRAQLKEKAKFALKNNYWKAVLVAMIFGIIAGGATSGITFDLTEETDTFFEDSTDTTVDYSDEYYNDEEFEAYLDSIINEAEESPAVALGVGIGLVGILFVVGIIALAIAMIWSVFIYNPLQMGCNRFFFKTLNQKGEVKEVAYAFDNNYKNVIKILFFKTLYTALWSLLFWIPGIVKGYEYRMIPYLLAENPNLTKEQAFAMSKQMMSGNKWKAFVLDLSFIGWDFLSACTVGILDIFYVAPYKNLTNAALYEQLSLIHGRPAFAAQQQNMGNYGYEGQPMEMNPFESSGNSNIEE